MPRQVVVVLCQPFAVPRQVAVVLRDRIVMPLQVVIVLRNSIVMPLQVLIMLREPLIEQLQFLDMLHQARALLLRLVIQNVARFKFTSLTFDRCLQRVHLPAQFDRRALRDPVAEKPWKRRSDRSVAVVPDLGKFAGIECGAYHAFCAIASNGGSPYRLPSGGNLDA